MFELLPFLFFPRKFRIPDAKKFGSKLLNNQDLRAEAMGRMVPKAFVQPRTAFRVPFEVSVPYALIHTEYICPNILSYVCLNALSSLEIFIYLNLFPGRACYCTTDCIPSPDFRKSSSISW